MNQWRAGSQHTFVRLTSRRWAVVITHRGDVVRSSVNAVTAVQAIAAALSLAGVVDHEVERVACEIEQ